MTDRSGMSIGDLWTEEHYTTVYGASDEFDPALLDAFRDDWGCNIVYNTDDHMFDVVSVPDDICGPRMSSDDIQTLKAACVDLLHAADVGEGEGLLDEVEADESRQLARDCISILREVQS